MTKLDRVIRSLVQLNITIEGLQTYGVSLICTDIDEIDLRSPMGKIRMQIIGAITEWKRRSSSRGPGRARRGEGT